MGYFDSAMNFITRRRQEELKTQDDVLLAIQKAGGCTPAHEDAWKKAGGTLPELLDRLKRMDAVNAAVMKRQKAALMQPEIDAARQKSRAANELYSSKKDEFQRTIEELWAAMIEADREASLLQMNQRDLQESSKTELESLADPAVFEERERLQERLSLARNNGPHVPTKLVYEDTGAYRVETELEKVESFREAHEKNLRDLEQKIADCNRRIYNPTVHST